MRLLSTLVLVALLGFPCLASGPPAVRFVPKEMKPKSEPPGRGALIGGALVPPGTALHWPTALEIVGLVRYHDRLIADALAGNFRMRYPPSRLFTESPDLREARAEIHRFWMNNQPSVLSYERLNGAIGP